MIFVTNNSLIFKFVTKIQIQDIFLVFKMETMEPLQNENQNEILKISFMTISNCTNREKHEINEILNQKWWTTWTATKHKFKWLTTNDPYMKVIIILHFNNILCNFYRVNVFTNHNKPFYLWMFCRYLVQMPKHSSVALKALLRLHDFKVSATTHYSHFTWVLCGAEFRTRTSPGMSKFCIN
jgi:hypothetical protein